MGWNSITELYWHQYLEHLLTTDAPLPVGNVVADFPGTPDIADALIDLYLTGRKSAGSGLVEDYESAGDPLPQPGDHWIAQGGSGQPRCILRTERVEIHRFLDVPERIALAEGEGDLSLSSWRSAHAAHFVPHLPKWGLAKIEDATVVTEFFTLVYSDPPVVQQ